MLCLLTRSTSLAFFARALHHACFLCSRASLRLLCLFTRSTTLAFFARALHHACFLCSRAPLRLFSLLTRSAPLAILPPSTGERGSCPTSKWKWLRNWRSGCLACRFSTRSFACYALPASLMRSTAVIPSLGRSLSDFRAHRKRKCGSLHLSSH